MQALTGFGEVPPKRQPCVKRAAKRGCYGSGCRRKCRSRIFLQTIIDGRSLDIPARAWWPAMVDWHGFQAKSLIGGITRIRMSFRPVTMQSYRFLTEIWSDRNPKLPIVSSSWKSLTEQERMDEAPARGSLSRCIKRLPRRKGHLAIAASAFALLCWPGVTRLYRDLYRNDGHINTRTAGW